MKARMNLMVFIQKCVVDNMDLTAILLPQLQVIEVSNSIYQYNNKTNMSPIIVKEKNLDLQKIRRL